MIYKRRFEWDRLRYIPVFSIALIYLEAVFRTSTGSQICDLSFLFAVLFSVAYGAAGYLLASLFSNRKVNTVIATMLLTISSLIYVVEYLVFKQFKQFYDLNTMTGGAGDALTSYFAELMDLIFGQGGIFVMLFLLVPPVLFPFLAKCLVPACQGNSVTRVVSAASGLLAYIIAVLVIQNHAVYGPCYGQQYNFQSAVPNYGLTTALRLDVKQTLFGGTYGFEDTAPDGSSGEGGGDVSGSEGGSVSVIAPVVYGDNALELDFAALDQKAIGAQKDLNAYVSTLTPSKKNEYTGLFRGKNMIFITAEAFSAEVIDPELTPTLYRLANKGIQFTDYYQPASAGTTGGEYQNIFGMLPTAGGRSFKNTADHYNYYTLGTQLNLLGYYGKAFHNNSHTYYSRNLTHNNIGYSDGFMGYGNGMEEYVKRNWPQSDYEMISGTLPTYIDKEPFNIYYMSVSGHSNYSKGSNSMTKRHWERVQHLDYSDDVKGYLAANLDLEDALTYLVAELEAKGIADDTVICISTDHFPYGLDSDAALGKMPLLSELYGYNVENYIQRDHSRLILWSGCLEDQEPIVVDSPTFSLDVLPTLFNLFGVEFDSRLLPGRDVFSDAEALVFFSSYDWKTELGTYYASSGKFVPASEDTVIPEGYVAQIKSIVRNKINYCKGVLDTDYFRLLFG